MCPRYNGILTGLINTPTHWMENSNPSGDGAGIDMYILDTGNQI